MAQFPVTTGDPQGVIDGVNYLLSGPSGLGQNFAGRSFSDQAWLTGNGRTPYVTTPIALEAKGADGSFDIVVTDISLFDIPATTYNVTGLNIGASAQTVSINTTTFTITLSVANVGPVAGPVEFNIETPPQLYVAPIALTSCTQIDSFTYNFVFGAAQPTPPFRNGNNVRVFGVTPTDYNRTYFGPGVVDCTTTDVTVQFTNAEANPGPGTGGSITFSSTNQPINNPTTGLPRDTDFMSTDCLGRATVQGAQDQVFISAQISNLAYYVHSPGTPADVEYTVAINRYNSFEFFDGASRSGKEDDVLFSFDQTIAQKQILVTGLGSPTGIIDPGGSGNGIDTVFSGVLDTPPPGYYLYRLEVAWRVYNTSASQLQVNQSEVGLRGITVQVIKE